MNNQTKYQEYKYHSRVLKEIEEFLTSGSASVSTFRMPNGVELNLNKNTGQFKVWDYR